MADARTSRNSRNAKASPWRALVAAILVIACAAGAFVVAYAVAHHGKPTAPKEKVVDAKIAPGPDASKLRGEFTGTVAALHLPKPKPKPKPKHHKSATPTSSGGSVAGDSGVTGDTGEGSDTGNTGTVEPTPAPTYTPPASSGGSSGGSSGSGSGSGGKSGGGGTSTTGRGVITIG